MTGSKLIVKPYHWVIRRLYHPIRKRAGRIQAAFLERSASRLPSPKDRPSPSTVRQIVVITKMGIGNFILFIPTLQHLRRAYPSVEIVLLCVRRGSDGAAFLPPGLVDRVLKFEGNSGRPSVVGLLKFFFRNSLKHDMVVVRWTSDPLISAIVSLLRPLYRVGHVSGVGFVGRCDGIFNYPVPITEGRHEKDLNLDLARALGIPIEDEGLTLHIPEEARSRAEAFLEAELKGDRPFIAVQVGTSELQPWKRWSMERWSALLAELRRAGHSVVLLGSGEETNLLEMLRIEEDRPGGPYCVNGAGRLSLTESAAVLKRSRLLLCGDTSLMHVAAATGTPQVVFWGPTQYDRTRPLSDRSVILRKPCLCAGSLFDKQVVQTIWACDQRCLATSVEEALKAILPLLPEPPSPSFGPPGPAAASGGGGTEIPCPLCGARESRVLFKLDFSKWRKGYKAFLRRCGRCDLLFNWPRPSLEELASFYGPDYYVFNRDEVETFKRMVGIYSRTVRMVEGLVPELRCLDIGSAGGHFPALLRALGWDARGVEISEAASAYAREHWQVPTFRGTIEEFSLGGERFPLITAIDVLEHVPDPHAFIRAIGRTCEPGAYLAIDTPNGAAFHFRALGATWRGFNPFHIQCFSPRNVGMLLEEHGFEVLRIFSYNNVFPKAETFPQQLNGNVDGRSVLAIASKVASQSPSYPLSQDARAALAMRCQGENLVVLARHKPEARGSKDGETC
jgi:ADP-heptose:LPS heptosyltransferase/SAM-dependent methyltransferase